jgi:hypothetical protein
MMQQSSPTPDHKSLHIIQGDREVAGYFEAGVWKSVTFSEFVRIVEESEGCKPPAYLKPVNGFVGITIMMADVSFLPTFAIPHFCGKACAGERCKECQGIMNGV